MKHSKESDEIWEEICNNQDIDPNLIDALYQENKSCFDLSSEEIYLKNNEDLCNWAEEIAETAGYNSAEMY